MNRKEVLKSWKYKLNLWKFYFEKGYSLLSYPKWVAAVYVLDKLGKGHWIISSICGFLFFLICLLIGWIWIKYEFFIAEIEVGNQYNLFVREVRKRKNI